MVIRQRAFLYFPPRGYPVTPASAGLGFEDLRLTTADGVRIAAWWVPAANAAAPVLMYCHGNGANLASFVGLAAGCHRRGVAFFALEYRGYGASEGAPTEAGLYADALAGWRWLESRGAAERTVVYGQSLGTAVAAWLAAAVPVRGLILEAALPSTWRMSRLHYPWLWVPEVLVRDRYRTIDHVARAGCPLLMLHGEEDEITPLRFGLEVFSAAAGTPKRFLAVPATGHNTLRWDEPPVDDTIMNFLAACLRRGA